METKSCKACREQIQAAATRCPKCQAYQSLFRNPQFMISLLMMPLVFVPMIFVFGRLGVLRQYAFDEYRDRVALDVASIERSKGSERGTDLVVLGNIRNDSDIKWEAPVIEILVNRVDEQPRDAINEQLYQFVILPGEENAFRLEVRSIVAENEIQGIDVSLKDARAATF